MTNNITNQKQVVDECRIARWLDGAFLDLGCLTMEQRKRHTDKAIEVFKSLGYLGMPEQPPVQPDKAEMVERVARFLSEYSWEQPDDEGETEGRELKRELGWNDDSLDGPDARFYGLAASLSALLPQRDDRGLVPLKPSEELLWILGQPNFACAGTANGLRAAGQEIPRKAEAEQAAVILWMLNLYLKHGEKWRAAGIEFLENAAKAAQAKAGAV